MCVTCTYNNLNSITIIKVYKFNLKTRRVDSNNYDNNKFIAILRLAT